MNKNKRFGHKKIHKKNRRVHLVKKLRIYRKKYKIPSKVSSMEGFSRLFFKFLFPKETVEYNIRPDWLRNYKTGRKLELDIFYPELKLAIEINGIVHGMSAQFERDKIKKDKCVEAGVSLVVIDDNLKCLLDKNWLIENGVNIDNYDNVPKHILCLLEKYEPDRTSIKSQRMIKRVERDVAIRKGEELQRQEIERNLRRLLSKGKITQEYFDNKVG